MLKTVLGALALCLTLSPVLAQDAGHAAPAAGEAAAESAAGGHGAVHIDRQPWTFAGIFGTFDQAQLQRGFQVFQTTCANCHGARLLSFRNLAEEGGPHFSEDQVKAFAATKPIADPAAEGGTRPGIPADRWPTPMDEAAAISSFGVVPPDLSVMAKARAVSDPFPTWLFNYFTTYAEGGPDYIHALLLGYEEPSAGTEVPPGKYYNAVFPGHVIAMSPPLQDGGVPGYPPGVPATAEQYSTDVSAFLMWVAEPHLVGRKEAGFRVILFLLLFAGLMYLVKDRLWRPVHHPGSVAGTTELPRDH